MTAKLKLPRKAIRVTKNDGDVGTFDSVKAACDATGYSHGLLMRFAATGEVDANGNTYELIDYVPKKSHNVSFQLSEAEFAALTAKAALSDKKPGAFAAGLIKGYLEDCG